ncbi:hypothetical protein CPB85DRAFT_1447651 [Mucidula mucida]|nr:hypothetical protein CPB85DRAFT_1447651 [Mucidula mucida]
MPQPPPFPPRPPVMQHSPPPPPPPPPIQQQQTQRPLPTPYQNSLTQPNNRDLMTDVGKAVGSMALKSVGGAMLSALNGGLLSSDVVDGLSTIFYAVAQGQPGADYQSIIDLILQTQQQQPQQQSSGIDYQAIISELLKIQKQSTHPPVAYQPPAVYHPLSFQSAPAPDFAAMYNQSYQNGMQQTIQIMEDAMKPNPYLQQQMQGQSQQTIQMLQYIEQQQLQAKQNLIDMMKAQNAALFGAAPSVGEHQLYYGGGQPSFGGTVAFRP